MDTSSSALARTLHLLAEHPGAQDELRKELRDARSSGEDIAYDKLMSLPYLDAVVRETLRLCVSILNRFNVSSLMRHSLDTRQHPGSLECKSCAP